MIRVERLAISRPMYAFNPDTWHNTAGNPHVEAAWFKRRHGTIVVTIGHYHPMVLNRSSRPTSDTYQAWIAAADDNRYGGTWSARSNGETTWFVEQEYRTAAATNRARDLLAAALAAYPEVPAGYDGWYGFPKAGAAHA